MKRGVTILLALGLAACGQAAANNVAANSVNIIAEEGIEDLNSAISGDELTPVPEADDDLAGNAARPAPVPAPATAPAPVPAPAANAVAPRP